MPHLADPHISPVQHRHQALHLIAAEAAVSLGTGFEAGDLVLLPLQHPGLVVGDLTTCQARLDALFLPRLAGIDVAAVDAVQRLRTSSQRSHRRSGDENGLEGVVHVGSFQHLRPGRLALVQRPRSGGW
jgi:hypothetical protein